MRNVHVYDIASSTWYTQPTTADSDEFPPERTEACAVAATAPDKSSYKIYVHGGYRGPAYNHTASGALWILTLPTFHWIRSKVDRDQDMTKAEHTCAKIHEKFMVVHRGVGNSNCDDYAGLQIVDLVSLRRVTNIDVGRGVVAYQVPQLVSQTIGGK